MANSLRQLIGGLILGKAEPAPLTGLDAARNSGWLAATTLPPAKPVKAPRGGGASVPGYRKTVDPSPAQIARQRFDVATVDLAATYRTATDTYAQARNLARVSPEAAASQAAHLRVGIPSGYIAIARDPDGEFSEDGTRLVLQILRRMERMADYENGFSQVGSLRSVSEALGRQMFQTGAMAMELVLDKSRLPLCFQPLPTTQLFLYEDGRGTKPVQRIGGQDIDLDIPDRKSVV